MNIKLRQNVALNLLISSIIAVLFVSFANRVEAAGPIISYYANCAPSDGSLLVSLQANKATYAPGETIILTGILSRASFSGTQTWRLTANGVPVIYVASADPMFSQVGTATLTAPNSGSYTITASATVGSCYGVAYGALNYMTVTVSGAGTGTPPPPPPTTGSIPTGTVSSSASVWVPACSIPVGARTCNVPFTWNISTNAAGPNLYNGTTATTYSNSRSGSNLYYPIVWGGNTVYARSNSTNLAQVDVTAYCVTGAQISFAQGGICVNAGTVTIASNITASYGMSSPAGTWSLMSSPTPGSMYYRPAGPYTITWNPVAGYNTPPSQLLSIVNMNDIISFFGNYTLACAANQGNLCYSSANACGAQGSGTIQCDGSCNASIPALPVGYGSACNSSANACGAQGSGTTQCNGSCNASVPALPVGYGNTCYSSANACGSVGVGSIQCNGACSASVPALPVGYGSACNSSANSCGMKNAGTVTCGGCNATTPPNSLCPASTVRPKYKQF